MKKLSPQSSLLTQQVKAVHKDLLAFEAKTAERFKRVDQRLDRLNSKLDGIDRKINSLAKALPGIVSDAVREANRERDKNH
jgi:seryl-tRNA synthetase